MNILALDLGSSTGYALNAGGEFHCGTTILATTKELKEQKRFRLDRRMDRRVVTLFQWVKSTVENHLIENIVFEDVMFSSTTYACQLWASLRAAVWLACPPNVGLDCVPVTTLKRFAGHGAADKNMMARFLCKADNRFVCIGKINPKLFYRNSEDQLQEIDHNCVDAVWIHRWGQHNLSRL